MANSPTKATLSLNLAYATSEITRLHDAVEAFLRQFAPPEKALLHFLLALEEIAANAIHYGNAAESAAVISVEVHYSENAISCEVVDAGAPFNPFSEATAPDLTSPLEMRQVGGLGIHIAKKVLDGYSYRNEAGRNHTTLVKRLGLGS